MRTLTIKRAKKYVAWMSKTKIYIEDPISGDTTIGGVPCRKLGELKNGSEKSFPIGNEAARVFTICDKLSKSFCNEFYPIPAGEEDVYLTGQHRYNLATGNAFVFDDNYSPEVLSNRKKNKKKGLVILVIAAIIGFISGFFSVSELFGTTDKSFTAEEMSITLTTEFFSLDKENFDGIFTSEDVVVLVSKDSVAEYEFLEDKTLEEYGSIVSESTEQSYSELKKEDGLTYFSYTTEIADSGDVYDYKAYIFKTDDAFWLVQFATLTEDTEAYAEQIRQWAGTISFGEENS